MVITYFTAKPLLVPADGKGRRGGYRGEHKDNAVEQCAERDQLDKMTKEMERVVYEAQLAKKSDKLDDMVIKRGGGGRQRGGEG